MLQQRITSDAIVTPLRVADAQAVSQYKNEAVVLKFCKEWDVTREEAEELFEETKKFLLLAAQCQRECFSVSIYYQFQVIDEMWHTFLQFTDHYYAFCNEYMGGFLHHFPFSRNMLKEEIKHLAKHNMTFATQKQQDFAFQLRKTQQVLGDDTVIKWYGEYAQKFSIESLNARRKPLMLDDLQTDEQGRVNAEMLKLPKEQILKYILDRNVVLNNVCGCSGKGCGAGCMCNSNRNH